MVTCKACNGTGDFASAQRQREKESEERAARAVTIDTEDEEDPGETSETQEGPTNRRNFTWVPWVSLLLLVVWGCWWLVKNHDRTTTNEPSHGFSNRRKPASSLATYTMYDLSITLPKAWHVSRLAQAGKWRVRTQGDTIRMQIESHRGSKPVNSYAREADKVFAHHAKTSSYHLITLKPLNVLGKPGCYWEFRKAIGTHGLRRRVIVYFNTATHYVSLLFDCAEATFGAQETTVHEVLDHLANKG